MLDISRVEDGRDLGLTDTEALKAANVLSVQLGSLEYAPDFGVDLSFFLDENFSFQKESFKAYLVQRLTEHQINVTRITDTVFAFMSQFVFFVGDASNAIGAPVTEPIGEEPQILTEEGEEILTEDGDIITGG